MTLSIKDLKAPPKKIGRKTYPFASLGLRYKPLPGDAPVDEGAEGATARDWKKGQPIRLIRSFKGSNRPRPQENVDDQSFSQTRDNLALAEGGAMDWSDPKKT